MFSVSWPWRDSLQIRCDAIIPTTASTPMPTVAATAKPSTGAPRAIVTTAASTAMPTAGPTIPTMQPTSSTPLPSQASVTTMPISSSASPCANTASPSAAPMVAPTPTPAPHQYDGCYMATCWVPIIVSIIALIGIIIAALIRAKCTRGGQPRDEPDNGDDVELAVQGNMQVPNDDHDDNGNGEWHWWLFGRL